MKALRFLMFNALTRRYLKLDPWFLRWNKRLRAVAVEMWYALAVSIPALFFFAIISILFHSLPMAGDTMYMLTAVLPFNIIMTILLNKDFFGSQSVVHRFLGYQVITIKTNKPAGQVRCMLRNILAPLWFLELPFLLFYPKRRLGDFIAGTKLIDVAPTDPALILSDIRALKLDREVVTALLLSFLYDLAVSSYILF